MMDYFHKRIIPVGNQYNIINPEAGKLPDNLGTTMFSTAADNPALKPKVDWMQRLKDITPFLENISAAITTSMRPNIQKPQLQGTTDIEKLNPLAGLTQINKMVTDANSQLLPYAKDAATAGALAQKNLNSGLNQAGQYVSSINQANVDIETRNKGARDNINMANLQRIDDYNNKNFVNTVEKQNEIQQNISNVGSKLTEYFNQSRDLAITAATNPQIYSQIDTIPALKNTIDTPEKQLALWTKHKGTGMESIIKQAILKVNPQFQF